MILAALVTQLNNFNAIIIILLNTVFSGMEVRTQHFKLQQS